MLDLVDGEVVVKDDLRDYMFRGSELERMNFLDFMLCTYDASAPKAQTTTHDQQHEEEDAPSTRRGRPANMRVHYQEGAKKPKRCRVVRTTGHETLPRFVGRGFPRNVCNTEAEHEFYAASMLALLQPWNDLRQLKGVHRTFREAFEALLGQGNPRIHRVIENIQYYYDCLDGAKARQEEEKKAQAMGTDDASYPYWDLDEEEVNAAIAEAEQTAAQSSSFEDDDITEEAIEMERVFQSEDREKLFAQAAISCAYDAGFFVHGGGEDVEWEEISGKADVADMPRIHAWEKLLKATTRKMAEEMPRVVLETVECQVAPGTATAHDVSPTVEPQTADGATASSATAARALRPKLALLNEDQRRAHDIVEKCIQDEIAGKSPLVMLVIPYSSQKSGRNPPQLRMLILGQGGTGKSLLISAITETFAFYGVGDWLAKCGTTGIAASEIEGLTVHSWAGLASNTSKKDDWLDKAGKQMRTKRRRNIEGKRLTILDEASMFKKGQIFCLSEIVGTTLAQDFRRSALHPFGGMHVILAGDFHQFPPVGGAYSALYIDHPSDDAHALLGREIFLQFDTVVILTEQIRVRDSVWSGILNRLRVGECDDKDIREVEKLVLTNPACDVPNFQEDPWSDAILITTRHGVRERWNEEAIAKHCLKTGNLRYVCPAEDIDKATQEVPSKAARLRIARMNSKATGKLADRLTVAKGMKAMVLLNVATEADIANGTRGVVEDIVLDPREEMLGNERGTVHLRYPPAMLLFRPDKPTGLVFDGIPAGLIPISPSQITFNVKYGRVGKEKTVTIRRRQFALTAGYAFTDYKSQGQTIERVIIDLSKPPGGQVSPFSAYVALSRSRGRDTIRILREFDRKAFQHHPSEYLRVEMERLEQANRDTKVRFDQMIFDF